MSDAILSASVERLSLTVGSICNTTSEHRKDIFAGWTLSVIIYITANVSGAHINPAVRLYSTFWHWRCKVLQFHSCRIN